MRRRMSEREDEVYVRNLFDERYGACLRKIPETSEPTPDYELVVEGKRCAVLEAKRLERAPRTPENGWRVSRHGPITRATREDNGPSRVTALIHKACRQFSAFSDPKILAFVNDENMLDALDMEEAFNGSLYYGNEQIGYANTSSAKIANGRIREEKKNIDLFIWMDRYKTRNPVFRFATDTGHHLAQRFFRCPAG